MTDATREHGPQPLDRLMDRWQLRNHDLVEASTEQLNHKQVQKGRHGRQLTLHLMLKIARAFNAAAMERLPKEQQPAFKEYQHKHLFSYAKGHDPEAADPNEELPQPAP